MGELAALLGFGSMKDFSVRSRYFGRGFENGKGMRVSRYRVSVRIWENGIGIVLGVRRFGIRYSVFGIRIGIGMCGNRLGSDEENRE